ncbi:TetR/AcrR family transcriptional regulator [Chelatococcus sambhunathii]|uniref:TetR/AcrR family transcriptional regulator n=1 Tax=Chelatococcus sambhunathii TaxID=363953 RepID=A0ABU1DCW5_9HYPH|nr:helix-turn-helix domain-containing protein [Chelatococcus sambhunathii]MDR4305934.1 TetR/AcrR family transcriptional regulator [Chelatococcus sambhunathii]
MSQSKTKFASHSVRGEPLRQKVLDAAERLLRQGKAEFSMRDLAAEASVSFATPFNQFGGKAALMHALSGRRIATMEARYGAARPTGDAAERLRLAVAIATEVMLEEPEVNRAVMGWIGAPGPTSGEVLARSSAFWALALDDGDGLSAERRADALRRLPEQLAFAFRGVLSFWTAGELRDETLEEKAQEMARSLLMGSGSSNETFSGTKK